MNLAPIRLRQFLKAGFAGALVVIASLTSLSLLNIYQLSDARTRGTRSHRAIASLKTALDRMEAAESAERGYVITGDAVYIAEFNTATDDCYRRLEQFAYFMGEQPERQERVQGLKQLLSARVRSLQSIVQERGERGFPAAAEEVSRNIGRAQTEQIRMLANGIESEEQRSLDASNRTADVWASRAVWGFVLLSGCTAIGLAFAFYFVLRDSQSREQSEHRMAVLNREMEEKASEMERRTTEMSILAQLASALRACTESSEAATSIAKTFGMLFPGCSGAVCLLNNSRSMVSAIKTWGADIAITGFAPEECCGLRTGRVHVATGKQLIDCRHTEPGKSHICSPLVAHGEILGAIVLQSWSASDLDNPKLLSDAATIARGVAERAAITLSSLRMRQALRDAAIRDPLTGLFNRRYMEETFARELARCFRKDSPLAILLIDIDNFKSFNDLHGHDVGDLVLKQAGLLMKSFVRPEDVVCRLGGEEFLVILPEADDETAEARADDLRLKFRSMSIRAHGSLLEPVTISIGVASTLVGGASPEELMITADKNLYAAKDSGRDRVVGSRQSVIGTRPTLAPRAFGARPLVS